MTSPSTPAAAPTENPYVLDVVEAHQARAQAFEAIEAERSERRREANAAFAREVVSATRSGQTSMTELAKAINLSRQELHKIVRTHG